MSFIASKLSFGSALSKFVEFSFVPVRNYAARKGTRERREKLKKKMKKPPAEKVKFIPHNMRKREEMLAKRQQLKYDDSWKIDPIDDVFAMKYYKWILYPFQEAVQNHRETHHPDMYNVPNANLKVRIELNMQAEKVTRFVDNFKRTAAVPHPFEHGEERPVLAFAKDAAALQAAVGAGAQLAGGLDLIKQVQQGHLLLNDFQHIVAHPDILPELVALRGLMKRRFPNVRMGTLDSDLGAMVRKFTTGIVYEAKKDEHEKDFGLIETVVGSLDMEGAHLEANFGALVRDVEGMRPKREGAFIRRCLLLCPPSSERFKVDHDVYIQDVTKKNAREEASEEEEERGDRVAL